MSTELVDSIVVFLDILGFKDLLNNPSDSESLLNAIKLVKENNTNGCDINYESDFYNENISSIKITPAITSFSDCIVMSVPLEKVKEQYTLVQAVNSFIGPVQQLADYLIDLGYIFRGGMAQGEFCHSDGVVFGNAMIDAYTLESSSAKVPRILVSNDLAKAYHDCFSKGGVSTINVFISKDDPSQGKDEYYFDFLRFSFQNSETITKYKRKTDEIFEKRKIKILDKINSDNFHQLDKDIQCLEKWHYFREKVKEKSKLYIS